MKWLTVSRTEKDDDGDDDESLHPFGLMTMRGFANLRNEIYRAMSPVLSL